jgi:hypothetical protein
MKKLILAVELCFVLVGCGGPASDRDADQQVAPQVESLGAATAALPADSCTASGGQVGKSACCLSTGDFPPSCSTGACGCAPWYSHSVAVCRCPSGSCFDGTECVPNGSVDPREQACKSSGGVVKTLSCCASVGDFPSSCLGGACGCAPASSHPVKVCTCASGMCFDGKTCVVRTRY